MLVSVTYGNETFNSSSAKYHLFVCRTEVFPLINPTQQHLWQAAKAHVHGISRHGGLNISDAAPGCGDLLGKWTNATYEIPEGMVIKLFGRLNTEYCHGPGTFGSLFLKLREKGPLVKITGTLTGDEKAAKDHVLVFEGRADILTDKEIIDLKIQVNYPTSYADMSRLFTIESVAPEVEEKAEIVEEEIENTKGEKIIVKHSERKRITQV